MKQKRKLGRKLLGFLLTLAMLVGLIPGMGLTAYADWDGDPYAALLNTTTAVDFDGKEWYLIENNSTAANAGTVTLLSKECVEKSAYNSSGSFVTYDNNPTIKGVVDTWYSGNITSNAKTAVNGNGMFLLTYDQANKILEGDMGVLKCNSGEEYEYWWLCSGGDDGSKSACVKCETGDFYTNKYSVDNTLGVRPALKLDLSKVVFDSTSNTFSVAGGNVDVTGISLTPLTEQTINVGEKVSFTASVSPDNATDKKVKWRVGGDNASAVKLYSDEACTTEVGADATDKLTVYAKGESAGSALVAATSNGDSTKSVTCNVTVNKANPTAPTGLTATYGQKLSDVALPTGWTWADSTQSVGSVVSPAATFKANFAGDDNYNAASNVNVTVTVGKADPTVPTGLTATYGQTLADVTLPDGWTWKDSTQSVGNVVSPAATFKANFAEDDNHNAAYNVDVTVTVGKANAVVATVTANNRTFDGTEKPLVTVTGEVVGGEMQYALGTKEAATEEYTTVIPIATNAGTYYVWYKALGDATHSDSNPAVVTITISEETPAEPEIEEGDTEAKREGSAHDDEKTSIDNDLTEIREIVSGEAQVDDSDTVRLIINTNSVDENADENKEAVDSIKSKIEADNLNIGSFLDITLSYIVEDANGAEKSSGQLTELNGRSLSVRFPIPSKLQASGRLFRIFRFHGGKAEEVGSGRGDAVVLSLDKFSLYAIAYEDGAATEETEESEKKVVKPHTHTYAWDKVEATESQDGELRYQCTECYDILVRVPLSAYYVFNANTVDKINKAKQGETVKITTDRWISFHKMVFDALTARPDVSLEVSFLDGEYKGNRVSFTIPAGADNSDLFTENNFAGFMYLGNKYGLTAEEN